MRRKRRTYHKYEVESLFQHKKYGYTAKIIAKSIDLAMWTKYYKFIIIDGPLRGTIREVPHIKVSVEFRALQP